MAEDKKSFSLKFFYPLIFFLFFVNYHFYSFYKDNFHQIANLIKTKPDKLSLYEKIQSEHPYYEIWRLAQNNKEVIFLNHSQDEKEIDYNTTYFKNINQTKKQNYFLSELKLFVIYYFYPKEVPIITHLNQLIFNANSLKKDSFIISDFELETILKNLQEKNLCSCPKTKNDEIYEKNFLNFYNRLKRLNVSKKNFYIVNRHPEKPYYLYQVVK